MNGKVFAFILILAFIGLCDARSGRGKGKEGRGGRRGRGRCASEDQLQCNCFCGQELQEDFGYCARKTRDGLRCHCLSLNGAVTFDRDLTVLVNKDFECTTGTGGGSETTTSTTTTEQEEEEENDINGPPIVEIPEY